MSYLSKYNSVLLISVHAVADWQYTIQVLLFAWYLMIGHYAVITCQFRLIISKLSIYHSDIYQTL